jgi:hypothetical protein
MITLEELVSEMRRAQRIQKQESFEHRIEIVENLKKAEIYEMEISFHPQAAKNIGFSVDLFEVYGFKNLEMLFQLKHHENAGISAIRIYSNGKKFRHISYKHNQIDTVAVNEIQIIKFK